MKKLPILIPMLFLLVPIINAMVGVTSPGSAIQLTPGQSERFQFEIQTVLLKDEVECKITFDLDPFIVKLDDSNPITIGPGIRYKVFGTVTAPKDIETKEYKKYYSVACSTPGAKTGGAVVQEIHGFLPFIIEVVNGRTKENPYVPPKKETKQYTLLISLLILIALLLIAYLIFIKKRKKSRHKK